MKPPVPKCKWIDGESFNFRPGGQNSSNTLSTISKAKSRRQSTIMRRLDIQMNTPMESTSPSQSPVMRRTRRMSMAVNSMKNGNKPISTKKETKIEKVMPSEVNSKSQKNPSPKLSGARRRKSYTSASSVLETSKSKNIFQETTSPSSEETKKMKYQRSAIIKTKPSKIPTPSDKSKAMKRTNSRAASKTKQDSPNKKKSPVIKSRMTRSKSATKNKNKAISRSSSKASSSSKLSENTTPSSVKGNVTPERKSPALPRNTRLTRSAKKLAMKHSVIREMPPVTTYAESPVKLDSVMVSLKKIDMNSCYHPTVSTCAPRITHPYTPKPEILPSKLLKMNFKNKMAEEITMKSSNIPTLQVDPRMKTVTTPTRQALSADGFIPGSTPVSSMKVPCTPKSSKRGGNSRSAKMVESARKIIAEGETPRKAPSPVTAEALLTPVKESANGVVKTSPVERNVKTSPVERNSPAESVKGSDEVSDLDFISYTPTKSNGDEVTMNGDEVTMNGDEVIMNGDEVTMNGDEVTMNGDETTMNDDGVMNGDCTTDDENEAMDTSLNESAKNMSDSSINSDDIIVEEKTNKKMCSIM